METKIIKVTRTLTLKQSVTLEVPKNLKKEDLEDALSDECEMFSKIEGAGLDRFDMKEDSNEYDIEEVEAPAETHLPFDSIEEALKDDDLL
jgi:hypothetical protein